MSFVNGLIKEINIVQVFCGIEDWGFVISQIKKFYFFYFLVFIFDGVILSFFLYMENIVDFRLF